MMFIFTIAILTMNVCSTKRQRWFR